MVASSAIRRLLPTLHNMPSVRSFSCCIGLHSNLTPTFSTTGNTNAIVSKLGMPRVAGIMFNGSLNLPFPPKYNVDNEEFIPGAEVAVAMVTMAAVQGDWECLEELMEPQCIAGLQRQVDGMGEVERELVALNPKDIFMSYISTHPMSSEHGNNLNLVTYSFPGLGKMKEIGNEIKARLDEMKKEAKTWNKEDVMQALREIENSHSPGSSKEQFDNNDIVVGNYRFIRGSSTENWVISEVGQASSKQAFNPYFRFRWRGRLGIHIKTGIPFLKILRTDLLSDYFVICIVVAYYVSFGIRGS